jgi:hypothetical protein
MDFQKIENIINELKANALGSIRGKNKVIDKIHQAHLQKVDSELMAVRIFVAKLSTEYSTKEALQMIDDFIYKRQIS